MKNCHYHHPIHTLCSATSPTMPSALPKGPQGGSSRSIIVEDDTITAPTTVSARQYEAVRDERKIKRSLHANMTGGNR